MGVGSFNGSGTVSRLGLVTALTAGMLGLPGSAQARPIDAVPRGSCYPGTTGTAADRSIAAALRPAMTGPRLGRLVAGKHIACARAIVDRVRERGFTPRAAVIAVATAIAESTLNNHTIMYDHDSLGLFQQRPSQGWGRPQQLVDPSYATDKFLDAMVRKHPNGRWTTGDIGAIAQRVQGSAYPLAYAPEAPDAALMVARLWRAAPPSTTGDPAPAPAPATSSPAPTGPLQRPLATTGAELGPLDGRHGLALADWSGDGRDDLIVIKGAGTGTGKTELRVLDGVSNFSFLLLTTATAVGPTDERHAYAVADFNADGRADLMVLQQSGTASGRTEARIVDGATGFQHTLLDTETALPPTGAHHRFTATDWNGDGRLDLVVADTSGKKVQVQVLDGAADFQRPLVPPITTGEAGGDDVQVIARDWNGDRRIDLVVLRKGTEAKVRVLDGAADFRKTLLSANTGKAADERHDLLVTDANTDGKPDLAVIQKTGTTSGRAEVTVLGG